MYQEEYERWLAAERYETLEGQQTQVVNSLRTDSIFG